MGNNGSDSGQPKAVDLSLVRELNRSLILNLIRQHGALSRADIAQRTHLSRSTVSSITLELFDENLITEIGPGKSRGGRRPILLAFNQRAGLVAGVDVGATHIRVLITDLAGDILHQHEADFDIAVDPEVGLKRIVEVIRSSLASAGVDKDRLVGLGIGIPGPVDYAQGRVVAPPLMPSWNGVAVRDLLEAQVGLPVYMDNDANLGALGERWLGAGNGYANLAYVKVGTGIGCGLILDGEIYRGDTGSAGEIGHVTIDENGPPCKCGSYGCLESMAGGPAIAQRAQQAVRAGQASSLAAIAPVESITAATVAQAAGAGDKLACQLFAEAGRHIGVALASLANLLNPGLIIIGGGVAEAGVLLLGPIRTTLEERALKSVARSVRISQSSLGRDATALGAVNLALNAVLNGPILVEASKV